MPKIVSAGNQWKSIEVPGEFACDTNLTFLSTFEELIPSEADQLLNKNNEPLEQNEETAVSPEEVEEIDSESGTNVVSANANSHPDSIQILDNVEAGSLKKNVKKKKKGLISRAGKTRIKSKKNEVQLSDGITSAQSDGNKKKMRKNTQPPIENCRIEDEPSQASDLESTDLAVTTPVERVDLSAWEEFGLSDEIMKALNDLGEIFRHAFEIIPNYVQKTILSIKDIRESDFSFTEPTEIQKLVFPSAIRDKLDIIGAAETGSGKTLAYVIPLIMRLLDEDKKEGNEGGEKPISERHLRALILAPTRELVIQIRKHIVALIKYTKFKVTSIVGGLSQQKQERILKYRPEIIVATPGRFWALLSASDGAGSGNYLGDWQHLSCLVIDETDRMIEKGHFEELQFILDSIKSNGNAKRQTLVFSATLTFVHPAPKRIDAHQITTQEKIDHLIEIVGLRKERRVFDITRSFGTAESLVETRMNCSNLLEKDTSVVYLLTRYPGRTLIFMNSVDASRRFFGILTKLQFKPAPMMLHAKMIQKQRLKNLEKFAEVPNSILLATDVAARGLDICGVEHVIHYQVPKTAELYVHRSGRTARALNRGITVLMVDLQDTQFYRRICRNLNREQELPLYPIDSVELFNALQERIKYASDVESCEHRIKKIVSRENWFEKTAREADLLLDSRDREKESVSEDLVELRREKKAAEGNLRCALSIALPRFEHVQVQKAHDALSSFEESAEKEQLTRKQQRTLVKFQD
ncbi:unnamed protein product [Anisakis simplex]|uniref:ATP-dependent RNA helicase n=1 Tax=Anisakis simplex TaxID=6269 RepID=A0A0M3JY51_ANISI|nr:unnamed protein product [Anisakis simplex]